MAYAYYKTTTYIVTFSYVMQLVLQCFDAVGWAVGIAPGL